MSYTQAEKLQTLMLCDIYEKLGIDGDYNPQLIRAALDTDNYWAIGWAYQDLDTGESNPKEVTFVTDVLDMYSILQYTYERLTKEKQEQLAKDVQHFNPKHDIVFGGFDWNNEGKYVSVTRMFKLLERFNTQNIEKNSHSPRVELYRRMLEEFLPIRKDFVHNEGISYEALCKVLNAQLHPSHR
ncbi:TPA: YfbU family protein [Serratia marcescens]|nr:YfbU family protein [Serratia marcescens]